MIIKHCKYQCFMYLDVLRGSETLVTIVPNMLSFVVAFFGACDGLVHLVVCFFLVPDPDLTKY